MNAPLLACLYALIALDNLMTRSLQAGGKQPGRWGAAPSSSLVARTNGANQ